MRVPSQLGQRVSAYGARSGARSGPCSSAFSSILGWVLCVGLGAVGCADVNVDSKTYACKSDDSCGAGFECGAAGVCVRAGGGLGGEGGEGATELSFAMFGATSHICERFEARIVSADRVLRARVVLEHILDSDFDFYLPAAVPTVGGPHTLDFFVDHDRNGVFTPPDETGFADHQWIREIPGDTYEFIHEGVFDVVTDPIPIGGDFELKLKGFIAAHKGKRAEAVVVDKGSGRSVGLYRIDPLSSDRRTGCEDIVSDGTFDGTGFDGADGDETDTIVVVLDGVIDTGSTYDVQLYVDKDGDGQYIQGADPSWLATTQANEQGELSVTISASDEQSPVEL